MTDSGTDVAEPGTIRVVCCQLAPDVSDRDGNVAAVTAAVTDAVARGADLVVLPELVTSGYVFASADEARAHAMVREDPLFRRWREAAGDAVLVLGFAEIGADGLLYNTAVLLAAGIEPVFYRKTHLWDTEKIFFAAGDEPPPVVRTRVGRVAVMICYDLEFPEMTRSVALRGAEVVAAPANWPLVERPPGLPAPEVVIAMAAARVNRLVIACCDRAGEERGVRWNEDSTVIGADGWPLAVAGPDGVVVADLDPGAARDKRISPRNDLLGDRRPSLYR